MGTSQSSSPKTPPRVKHLQIPGKYKHLYGQCFHEKYEKNYSAEKIHRNDLNENILKKDSLTSPWL